MEYSLSRNMSVIIHFLHKDQTDKNVGNMTLEDNVTACEQERSNMTRSYIHRNKNVSDRKKIY
jgi:hypothetical protein